MPTYSYVCRDCRHAFDIQQAFTDDALTTCPECEGTLRKIFSAVGVVFKGSGFYRTDSRGSGPRDATTSAASDKASDKAGDKAGARAGDKAAGASGGGAGEKAGMSSSSSSSAGTSSSSTSSAGTSSSSTADG